MLKQLYLVCAINQILAGDQNIGSYLSKERIISQFGYEGTEGQNVDITRQMLVSLRCSLSRKIALNPNYHYP